MSLKGIHFSRRHLLAKLAVFSSGAFVLPGSLTKAYGRHDNNSGAAKKLRQYSGIKADFLDDNFLLHSKTAEILYHEYAKGMPIIDYHCHLPPNEIAGNKQFTNLSQIWLEGDHYKMRAMRANGVAEKYITGDAPDAEKFAKWAETIPYAIRNPLYHWTHLELKRYFGITQILNSDSASQIYDTASQLLRTDEYRVQNLIKNKKVEILCTTDDPADDLNFHREIKRQGYEVTVLPAWRPDKALAMENVVSYNTYLDKLSAVANTTISKYSDLIDVLKKRQQVFHFHGCKVSDHGVETFYAEDFTETEIAKIFAKARAGNQVSFSELKKI